MPGTVYWKAIRSSTAQEFFETTRAATPERIERLSLHVYELAGIATHKYEVLKFSFGSGIVAASLGLLSLAFS